MTTADEKTKIRNHYQPDNGGILKFVWVCIHSKELLSEQRMKDKLLENGERKYDLVDAESRRLYRKQANRIDERNDIQCARGNTAPPTHFTSVQILRIAAQV